MTRVPVGALASGSSCALFAMRTGTQLSVSFRLYAKTPRGLRRFGIASLYVWTCPPPTPDQYAYELAVDADDQVKSPSAIQVEGDPGFAALEDARYRLIREAIDADRRR